MRPLRRTILQFSQILLTLERTFMTGPIVKKAQRRSRETLDARGLFAARSARHPAVWSRSIARIDHPLATPQAVRDPACAGIGRLYAKGRFVHKQTQQRICAKSEALGRC
jgi:hypothetical protein